MSSVGNIRGQLIFRLAGTDLNLGDVLIPLEIKTSMHRSSGDDTPAIGLAVNLAEVRDVIAAILQGGAQ